jgi:hypothetical protein
MSQSSSRVSPIIRGVVARRERAVAVLRAALRTRNERILCVVRLPSHWEVVTPNGPSQAVGHVGQVLWRGPTAAERLWRRERRACE